MAVEVEGGPFPRSGREVSLKARDPDPARSTARCESLGAENRGTVAQHDTYFQGPRGRLKMRQEEGRAAQLIAYERLALVGQGEGRRWFFEIAQPQVIIDAFSESLGVEAIVVKRRHLFSWEGIEIRLDEVDGLGHFIGLEASAEDDTELRAKEAIVNALRGILEIDEADETEERYCDLVMARRRHGA